MHTLHSINLTHPSINPSSPYPAYLFMLFVQLLWTWTISRISVLILNSLILVVYIDIRGFNVPASSWKQEQAGTLGHRSLCFSSLFLAYVRSLSHPPIFKCIYSDEGFLTLALQTGTCKYFKAKRKLKVTTRENYVCPHVNYLKTAQKSKFNLKHFQ